MKIDFGHGVYLEPDPGPHNSRFHKRIVGVAPIPGTQAGHRLTLECGHRLTLECGHRPMAFGDLKHIDGVVLCVDCRDQASGRGHV